MTMKNNNPINIEYMKNQISSVNDWYMGLRTIGYQFILSLLPWYLPITHVYSILNAPQFSFKELLWALKLG